MRDGIVRHIQDLASALGVRSGWRSKWWDEWTDADRVSFASATDAEITGYIDAMMRWPIEVTYKPNSLLAQTIAVQFQDGSMHVVLDADAAR